MLASFVTYQGLQGLMQDNKVGCAPIMVGPRAEPGLVSLNILSFPITVRKLKLSGWGETMDREEDSKHVFL